MPTHKYTRLNRAKALLIATAFTLFYILPKVYIKIDSGQAGVLYRTFQGGTDTTHSLQEGIHWIAPWNKVTIYNVRTQEITEEKTVLSNNGLSIKVNVSYRYSLALPHLAQLHQKVGPHYLESIIAPQICASVRTVIGQCTPEELYSTQRDTIQEDIYEDVKKSLAKSLDVPYIHLERLLILNIDLPPTIKNAIEQKLRQQQEYEEYAFRLRKEEREADRKKIEAEGFKELFQVFTSQEILQLRGIEATKALANSHNAKIIIIGNTANGLPLMLGNLATQNNTSDNQASPAQQP